MQDHTETAHGSEPAGAVGQEGEETLGSHGRMWLACLISLWSDKEVKPIRLKTKWGEADPGDGELARERAFPV